MLYLLSDLDIHLYNTNWFTIIEVIDKIGRWFTWQNVHWLHLCKIDTANCHRLIYLLFTFLHCCRFWYQHISTQLLRHIGNCGFNRINRSSEHWNTCLGPWKDKNHYDWRERSCTSSLFRHFDDMGINGIRSCHGILHQGKSGKI